MTTHTFWILALRITGIIISVFGFDEVLMVFNDIVTMGSFLTLDLMVLFILTIAFYVFIFIGFVLSPELIIRTLKLTKGVEHAELKTDLSSDYFLKMALLIIGGCFLLNSLLILISLLVSYVQFGTGIDENPMVAPIVNNLIKAAVGYFLFFHSAVVVKFLKDKLAENEQILDAPNQKNME